MALVLAGSGDALPEVPAPGAVVFTVEPLGLALLPLGTQYLPVGVMWQPEGVPWALVAEVAILRTSHFAATDCFGPCPSTTQFFASVGPTIDLADGTPLQGFFVRPAIRYTYARDFGGSVDSFPGRGPIVDGHANAAQLGADLGWMGATGRLHATLSVGASAGLCDGCGRSSFGAASALFGPVSGRRGVKSVVWDLDLDLLRLGLRF